MRHLRGNHYCIGIGITGQTAIVDIYRFGGTCMKDKKDPEILKDFLKLYSSLFLRYDPRFPLAYKRESSASHEGRIQDRPSDQ